MLNFTEKLNNRIDIYKFMTEHGLSLKANTDFCCRVIVKHLDGSEFFLNNCLYDQCEDKIYIWTEHCGYLYFYKDDLKEIDIKKSQWNAKENEFQILEHTIMIFNTELD